MTQGTAVCGTPQDVVAARQAKRPPHRLMPMAINPFWANDPG